MTEEKLDQLLEEVFEQKVEVEATVVYKARRYARNELAKKEARKEQYPFWIVFILNTLITLMVGLGLLLLMDNRTPFITSAVFSGVLILTHAPVIVYLVAKIYYKECKTLREE